MNDADVVRVGFVGVGQANFSGDKEGVIRRSIDELTALSKELGFAFYPVRTPVYTADEAEAARQALCDARVDMTFVQCSSFASGVHILKLVDQPGAICLWGVPEPASEGRLPLNSFCAVNMFASIIRHYLYERDIRYKWFWGFASDGDFKQRLAVTLKALKAIKVLRQSRIALLGGIAPYFLNLKEDERDIRRVFGTEIVNIQEISDVIKRAKAIDPSRASELAKQMAAESSGGNAVDDLDKAARFYLAMEQMAQEMSLRGFALSCWPKLQELYQYSPCSAVGRLNENGIVVSCEGDVLSAVSMLALNSISGRPSVLMDMSAFDPQDETIELWHCGAGPRCWANGCGMRLNRHFNQGFAAAADMVMRPGPVTVMRFTQRDRAMFSFTANVIDRDKPGFDGTRGWLGDLSAEGKPVRATDLVNTIVVQGMQHHFPVAFGQLADELTELGAWLGLSIVPILPYSPYMQNQTIF